MTARIFIKLILAVTGVLAVALTSVNLIATPRVRASFMDSLARELAEKAHTAELALPRTQTEFASLGAVLGGRVTWIAPDGLVLGDSDADSATMENHARRPEVAEALQGKIGRSLRVSPTVGTEYFYVAVPVARPRPGSVLRVAVPSVEVDQRVRELRNSVLAATTLAFLPAVLLAAYFARYASNRLGAVIDFSRRLTEGNFQNRLSGAGRGEFGLLSSNLNQTSERLQFMMQRLESEHAELEKLERIRKDFVINVSHELRTPLASIQGYTETLLDGAAENPTLRTKFLNIIRQNTERLTRLTADLLVLSRVELGQQELKFTLRDLDELLQTNVDSLLPLASAKNITLVLAPAPADAVVFADAEAVHQILTNLLENAIKYTPEGGTVTVSAQPSGPNKVEISVCDTGLGIPSEDLPRLFERFYRVDKARSKALGGTGLGLAIVKHLVHAHGGEVNVESTPDKGSRFFFTLPNRDVTVP